MNNHTPAAHWLEKGEPDPHGSYYDRERSQLALGNLTDDELANAVFLYGDTPPSAAEIMAGTAKMPIVYLTAGKERIRWLSRNLVNLEQKSDDLLAALEKLTNSVLQNHCEADFSDMPGLKNRAFEAQAIIAKAKGEKICDGCGHSGGGKCPDCGPVMGDATYQEMFGEKGGAA